MSNTLTALAPVLYSAAQEVSAEPFGVVDAINAQFDNKGVAIGDKVKVPVAPTRTPATYSPTMNLNNGSAGDDAIAAAVEVEISANRMVSWHLTGEQQRSLQNAGNDNEWVRQLVAQGMRALRNEAETAAAAAIKVGASRAVGTAGTAPFGSDINVIAEARKILHDNGAPLANLQMCIDTAAGLNLRKLGIIQQAYMAGSDAERRSGEFLRQFGFQIRESAGIALHTKGTGASYVTDGIQAAKSTAVVLKTGTGTVLAGDVVTFAADSANKYVVNTGITEAGTAYIGRPGLKVQIATGNALTVGNNYTPNLAFERDAVVGVMRPPLIPANANIKQLTISDGKGMSYLLCEVVGDGMVTWRLHLAYGFKVVQPEHVALIMG